MQHQIRPRPLPSAFFRIHYSLVMLQLNDIVTWRPKAGIVEPQETSIARQRLGKHVPAETNQRDNAVARAADSW
jgi:hypothetical protein